jgi:hypothetical protein
VDLWIPLNNMVEDRFRGSFVEDVCRGSYLPIWWRRGAVDPTKQWVGGGVLWILLSNGSAERCCGSY